MQSHIVCNIETEPILISYTNIIVFFLKKIIKFGDMTFLDLILLAKYFEKLFNTFLISLIYANSICKLLYK